MAQWEMKRQSGNMKDLRDWSGLPEGILGTISRKVALRDCPSYSKVCKSWRSSLMEFVVHCPKLGSRGFPWLLKSGAQDNSKTRSCLSVLENKLRHLELPTKYGGSWFWGSFEDWLIMVKPLGYIIQTLEISLLNPFSGAEVLLPKVCNIDYVKLVFSGGYPDCMYLMFDAATASVALWIHGLKNWGVYDLLDDVEDFEQHFKDAIYYDGCFYVLTRKYDILVIDVASASQTIKTDGYEADIKRHTRFHEVEMCCATRLDQHLNLRYLLEFNGEILLVCQLLSIIERKGEEDDDIMIYDDDYRIHGFKIFRLDLCLMKWVELDSLGDKVLFVSRRGSRCFSANELGLDDRMANCIYFTHEYKHPHPDEWDFHLPHRSKMDDWGIFRLDGDGDDHCFSCEAKIDRGSHIWINVPLWWYFQRKN